jgi:hypothetical protein
MNDHQDAVGGALGCAPGGVTLRRAPSGPTDYAVVFFVDIDRPGGANAAVLRHINTARVAPPFIRNEIEISRALAQAGLGPPVLDASAEDGWILFAFVDAVVEAAGCALDDWCALGARIRRLHALDGFTADARSNYLTKSRAWIEHARRLCEGPRVPDELRVTLEMFEASVARAERAPALAFCHNDLHFGNVMFTHSGPVLVDHDHCGAGDAAFDLATIAVAFGLSCDAEAALLVGYGDPAIEERIGAARRDVLVRYAISTLGLLSGDDVARGCLTAARAVRPFGFSFDSSRPIAERRAELALGFALGALARR